MLPDTQSHGEAESQLASARSQLVRRLRAGEPCCSEDLLDEYPALHDNKTLAVQLVCTEFAVLMELGRQVPQEEWFQRFPEWRDDLRARFEVYADHRAHDPRHPDSDPTVPYGLACEETVAPGEPLARLGRYDLLEQVGGGGMGVVYKARQLPPLERIVAVKQLRGGRLANPEEIRRFSLEAQVAGGLRHAHLLPIYELAEHDGQMFLTMPFVETGSLARHLARFRDQPRTAAALVEKIARAVHFLHVNGILHRDLKPSNILLDEHDEPLVTDFGLAKRVEDADPLTETGRVMGTPAYLSPEQAAGRNRDVAAPSDVWALGVILYELLTGRRPFQSADREELYRLIQAARPPALRPLAPAVDAKLEAVVLHCLAKEPAHRYATAAALADDLRRWLDGLDPLERPPGPGRRAWQAVRRNPRISAAAVALGCLAVGLGAGYTLVRPTAPHATTPKTSAVVWIGGTGPPAAYTTSFGAADASFRTNPAEPFGVLTPSLALVDVVPDLRTDHYRVALEVQHVQGNSGLAGAGLIFGHRTIASPDGMHHFVLVLGFNERLAPDLPGGVSLELFHFLDNGRDPVATRTFQLGAARTFADVPPGRANPWHQATVELTPERIKIVVDDKALREVAWSRVTEKTAFLLKTAKLPAPVEAPTWGPQGGLGLYVLDGEGWFRSLRVEPLVDDK